MYTRRQILMLGVGGLLLSTTGCFRYYKMPSEDQRTVAAFEKGPIALVIYKLDPELDISEGDRDIVSWLALSVDKDNNQERLLATDVGDDNPGSNILMIVYPYPEKIYGKRIGVLNHSGSTIYNQTGDSRPLKELYSKLEIKDFEDFLPEMIEGLPYLYILNPGDGKYEDLLDAYKKFRVYELEMARQYIYKKYWSRKSEKELEEIAMNDSIVRSFIEWLGKDWHLFISFNTISIGTSALMAGAVKIFSLPSIFADRINQPGYDEYIPNTKHTAKMIKRAVMRYGKYWMTGVN